MNETDQALTEAVAQAIQASWPDIIKAWEAGTGDIHTLDNLDELDAMDMATAAVGAMKEYTARRRIATKEIEK